MVREFRSSDTGKSIVNDEGDELGTVDRVEGDTVYAKPSSGLSQRVRQRLGWDDEDEETFPLSHDQVDRIEGNEIRLKSME